MSARPRGGAGRRRTLDFTRLTPGDLIAAVAALVLLLFMALDWYGTRLSDQARRIERTAETSGAESGQVGRALEERAVPAAEEGERTAWQAGELLDRVLLAVLLAAILLALAAALLRAAARRFEPPLTPSAMAGAAALAGAALIFVRIGLDQPGLDTETTIRDGPVLALAALGLLLFGSARAMRREASAPPGRGAGDPQP